MGVLEDSVIRDIARCSVGDAFSESCVGSLLSLPIVVEGMPTCAASAVVWPRFLQSLANLVCGCWWRLKVPVVKTRPSGQRQNRTEKKTPTVGVFFSVRISSWIRDLNRDLRKGVF